MKNLKQIKGIWIAADGELRVGWRVLLGAVAWFAAFYGVLAALSAMFGALFDAWGLTTSNVGGAPQWARWVVAGHTDFSYAAAYASSVVAGILAVRKWTPERRNGSNGWTLRAALLGLGLGAWTTALSLVLDSMRLENPLGEPRLNMYQLVALLLVLLGKVSAEVLTKRVAFDGIRSRGRRWTAYLVAALASAMLAGVWTSVPGAVNSVLLGLLCCVLYECGGLAASTAMQAVWTAWCALVFGFPGMTASASPVYALYFVSDAWLTGGNAGPMNGLWMTVGLLAALGLLMKNSLRTRIRRRALRG